MRKRNIAALIAAMVVAVVGIFGSFFLSIFFREGGASTITLPEQGSAQIDLNPNLAQTNRDKVEALTVDRKNIQSVIEQLQRPEVYQCQIETTYFYRDASAVWTSSFWRNGRQIRISQRTPSGEEGTQVLLTENWVYVWGAQEEYRRFSRQERDEDLYSRAPTYEDLLQIPSEQILKGEVREQDGYLCLYTQSQDEVTGELEEWYILVENGLLLLAQGQIDGRSTYRAAATEISLELPADMIFTLPDGTVPQ